MTVSTESLDGRRFGLDVMRALSISGVVCAHYAHDRFFGIYGPLGYLAVELIFVLSGFLIGGLLLDIVERGASVREWFVFMQRRWMRTVPLYVLWTVMMALAMPPADGWLTVVQTLTFTQNLAWRMPSDNWFGVSWTLTIEEWFYLLFSALLLGLAMIRRSIAIPVALVVFLVAPTLARIWVSDMGGPWGETVRKIVVGRLDAIGYGVLVAVLWRNHAALLHRFRIPLLVAGLVAVTYGASLLTPQGAARWWLFSLLSAGFALVVPAMVVLQRPRNVLAPIFEWISTRSYGLYIFHLTIVFEFGGAISNLGAPYAVSAIASLLLSMLLADLSWRYFEKPILRGRPKQFAKARAEPAQPLPAAS